MSGCDREFAPTAVRCGCVFVLETDVRARLDGRSIQNPRSISTRNAPAPLPVIGLRAGWAVSPHWLLGLSGQYFRLSSGSYTGYLGGLRADATCMYNRNIGLGIGYNSFYTNVDVDKSRF